MTVCSCASCAVKVVKIVGPAQQKQVGDLEAQCCIVSSISSHIKGKAKGEAKGEAKGRDDPLPAVDSFKRM
jgi:hypothetical protein